MRQAESRRVRLFGGIRLTDPSRLRSLDLIRGVAVLGILAVNVLSFAGPGSAAYSPDVPAPGSAADHWAFAFTFVFFEGKMRALFSILFGASLLLFIDRREAAGTAGAGLQVRRLLWLALFGLLHFALLWDGDILLLYACVGLGALALRRAPARDLALIAALLFTVWQAWGTLGWLPSVWQEARVAAGTASPREEAAQAAYRAALRDSDRLDTQATLAPYGTEVATRLTRRWDYPLAVIAQTWGETLSYVMIGMALLKSGFFAAAWPRRRVVLLAAGGLGSGLALTLAFTGWAMAAGWPAAAMRMAVGYALGWPHLLMALGYAALLVLAAPVLLRGRPGRRLEAAGQMAFTNYIATTLIMTALFSGWGLGLFGRFGPALLWPLVLIAWALMLGWSAPWLARYRHGPLEWLWRSLTDGRIAALRR